jgi:streptogramin lyase
LGGAALGIHFGGEKMNNRKMKPAGSAARPHGPVWRSRALLAGILLGAALAASGQIIQEFPPLPGTRGPEGIVLGPDGNLWFCEESGNRIGKASPAGVLIDEFALPVPFGSPETIVVGPDGNLWFTAWTADSVGRITTDGVITMFPTISANSEPEGIAVGPDGNIWFTEANRSKIGRLTTDGVMTEFDLPNSLSRPEGMTAGPDGALWFVQQNGNRIGRITTQGVVTQWPLPTAGADPWNITVGADGNLWFSEGSVAKIGRITPAGVITEFPILSPAGTPDYLTLGPDGNVWFTIYHGDKIGRITPSGVVTEFPLPTQNSNPYGITVGPDGAIWFAEFTGNRLARITTAAATPQALIVGDVPNEVFEAGETLTVAPEWENTLTSSSDLTGAAANLTGPGGPSYTINDGAADYGTVPAESSASCADATGDCYSMTITGARPVPHWDAAFTETITPGAISKDWSLHVGESFPDVPTSNQFYFFIETLFHSGVTGGCGLGNYCPDNSVTRGQMAVFLLKSRFGSSFVPPPATGTVFNDVPASHPFAAWIESLAGFKITGGCGSGNYCPENPVTRGQMAVFLLKSEHGSAYVPPACTGAFDDVPCPGNPFVDWIEQLFAEGITGGCGGNNYCPNNPNTRGQMAVFLTKTFGLRLYGP